MTLKNFEAKFNNEIKKGCFISASWQSVKTINGKEYKKVSQGVVRFVQYGNIAGVQVAGKINVNEECIIPSALYYNSKTNNYLVQLSTTETKPHCTYYINGEAVDKATFELENPPRHNSQASPVFRVKLENLLSLGE